VSWALAAIADGYHSGVDLLRHLRFFVAVAEVRHFGRAAASLGMTQPPLSQGVQRLETHLGVQLFDRGPRGVRITDAGLALLPRARDLLTAESHLTQHAADHSAARTVRIGLAHDVDERVTGLVTGLAATGTAVMPRMAGSVELTDLVRDGDLDVALVRYPGVVDGTRPRAVHHIGTRIIAPEDLKGGTNSRPVQVADLGLPVVVPPRRHHPAAHDQFVNTLRRLGHTGATLEEPDPLARSALVAAGRAVRLTVDPTTGRPVDGDPFPLRLRVVLPVPAARRTDIDHEHAATTLENDLG